MVAESLTHLVPHVHDHVIHASETTVREERVVHKGIFKRGHH